MLSVWDEMTFALQPLAILAPYSHRLRYHHRHMDISNFIPLSIQRTFP
jgi:hypothetical protein